MLAANPGGAEGGGQARLCSPRCCIPVPPSGICPWNCAPWGSPGPAPESGNGSKCPEDPLSFLTAVIFRAVALGGALPCEYAPGCTCRVRVSAQLCSSCRRCWGPCSNLLCTLLWSFTLSWGRNQPGNSFPSAFEALSWDSSLLAVIQHRIACSSSLASNTALCNCSR